MISHNHRTFFSLLIFLFSSLASLGLGFRSYDSALHERFINFANGGTQPNPNFIHADVDLTGVGYLLEDSTHQRALTLVSPRHFVCAWHFKPAAGQTARFINAAGEPQDFTIATTHRLTNDQGETLDLAIGELTTDVPPSSGVTFLPFLNLKSLGDYTKKTYQNLIVLGRQAQGSSAVINGFTANPVSAFNGTLTLNFRYFPSGDSNDVYYQSGDSGGPVFAKVNGKAYLMGVHSALLSLGSDSFIMYANFVGHEPYVDQLDTIMAADGYNMSRANNSSDRISVDFITPQVARAGHPFTLHSTLTNLKKAGTARNLRLSLDSPASTDLIASGTDWSFEYGDGVFAARRGSLPHSSSTSLSKTFTVETPQELTLPFSLYSNGNHRAGLLGISQFLNEDSDSVTQNRIKIINVDITVIESFLSYTSGLTLAGENDDPDADGLSNLEEYAFGGDPAISDSVLSDTSIALTPELTASGSNEVTISYIRRTDASARALDYSIVGSSVLSPSSESTSPINDDFELVSAIVNTSEALETIQVVINLSE